MFDMLRKMILPVSENAAFFRCQVAKIVVRKLRDDFYNILAVNCIYRAFRFLCTCVCVYACGLAIFVDTMAYLKYRTSVRVDRSNLSNLEFPALTICNIHA